MASNKHFDLRKKENSGIAIFKEHLFFLNKKLNAFEIKKIESFGQKRTTLFFLTSNCFIVCVIPETFGKFGE